MVLKNSAHRARMERRLSSQSIKNSAHGERQRVSVLWYNTMVTEMNDVIRNAPAAGASVVEPDVKPCKPSPGDLTKLNQIKVNMEAW